MEDIQSEADYIYYTLASLATLLVLAVGWRVFSSRETQSSQRIEEVDRRTLVDGPDEDLADVDNLLIKASEIEVVDPQKAKEATGPPGETKEAKKVRLRAKHLEEQLKKGMTDDQIAEERKVREQQLAAIFQLMKTNEERFGVDSMEDVQSQYKLYA